MIVQWQDVDDCPVGGYNLKYKTGYTSCGHAVLCW